MIKKSDLLAFVVIAIIAAMIGVCVVMGLLPQREFLLALMLFVFTASMCYLMNRLCARSAWLTQSLFVAYVMALITEVFALGHWEKMVIGGVILGTLTAMLILMFSAPAKDIPHVIPDEPTVL